MTWTAPDVTRPDGPPAADERTMLQAYLDWHRSTLLHDCAGLTGEQLATRAIPQSTLTLLGLIRHMAKVERVWFRIRFAGLPVEPLHQGKDTDFDTVDAALAEEEYARLVNEVRLADQAVAEASLDDTFVHEDEVFPLRMIYLHMIGEYARHNGHADLLRQLTDGRVGA